MRRWLAAKVLALYHWIRGPGHSVVVEFTDEGVESLDKLMEQTNSPDLHHLVGLSLATVDGLFQYAREGYAIYAEAPDQTHKILLAGEPATNVLPGDPSKTWH